MATIAVAGSGGLIGTELVEQLRYRGDEVFRLVRKAGVHPDEIGWNPAKAELNLDSLEGVDAIVNLCGAAIGRQWTPAVRREIIDSRVDPTRTLACAAATLGGHVTLVNASAVGIYGDRGSEPLTEEASPGQGFVPELVQDWEAATAEASDAGNRVALARTGLVMAPDGGALAPLLPLLKRGLGGALGPGTQIWPWISLLDEVRALLWLLDHEISGPVNLAAPAQNTNEELLEALAEAMGSKLRVGAPTWAIRLGIGEFANEIVASQHQVPKVLLDSGFEFVHPTLPGLAGWLAAEQDEK